MMKLCKKCQNEFPRDEFYRLLGKAYKDSWDCRDSYCKKCRIEYTNLRRRETKRLAVEYLGGKCVDCGLVDLQEVYDFHHADPTQKDFTIGKSVKIFERIKTELDKCVLLCSNCHRKRHSLTK